MRDIWVSVKVIGFSSMPFRRNYVTVAVFKRPAGEPARRFRANSSITEASWQLISEVERAPKNTVLGSYIEIVVKVRILKYSSNSTCKFENRPVGCAASVEDFLVTSSDLSVFIALYLRCQPSSRNRYIPNSSRPFQTMVVESRSV